MYLASSSYVCFCSASAMLKTNRHAPPKRRIMRICSLVGISSNLKAWSRCMIQDYQHSHVVKDAGGVRVFPPPGERRGLTRIPIEVRLSGLRQTHASGTRSQEQ